MSTTTTPKTGPTKNFTRESQINKFTVKVTRVVGCQINKITDFNFQYGDFGFRILRVALVLEGVTLN